MKHVSIKKLTLLIILNILLFMENKRQFIVDWIKEHNYSEVEFSDLDLNAIYELYKNDTITPVIDGNTYFHFDRYYRHIMNYPEMKKYYQMAIQINNSDAMCNLGVYYKEVEKDYTEMKKYYQMAIQLNNSCAMNYLGNYYRNI